MDAKVKRFYKTEEELQQRDFISTQLNDTRYISKLALEYVERLGCDVSTIKGVNTAWLRHQWGLNNLLGETDKKERTDHRHHALDAAIIACVNRGLYKKIYTWTQNNVKELKINTPYPNFREELEEQIKHVAVSHVPQRKLSGSLHEETGAGYIEKHGGLVYRKKLSSEFTLKNAHSIVDESVKELVLLHLKNHENNPKKAFADDVLIFHKDGKTPVNRVRILQSKTTLKTLEQSKLGVKDKLGNIFKWMAYGNMHHVEIIQHKETEKYKGIFVTMMEAHRRAMTGTSSAQRHKINRESIILQNHGDEWQFVMALHRNDLVSVSDNNGERIFYRIQKLGGGYDLTLRLHSETTTKREKIFIENKKMLENSFNNFLSILDLKVHKINAIGIITNDKANY